MAIRIGIVGYGNLGRGVENAIRQTHDMQAVAVFSRRDPESVKPQTAGLRVVSLKDVVSWKDAVDVMILCGGSATDLPAQTPELAGMFNVVDSFDTHACIQQHFAAVDAAAQTGGHLAIISVGWDPGLFSLNRLISQAVLPDGKDETFWGKGVSQGHSDAVRRLPGVKDARQYTLPVEASLARVRAGGNPDLTARQKHLRQCFVVAEEGADQEQIAAAIKSMPHYFADYDTSVEFITEAEMKRDHARMPHGGFVIRNGKTGAAGENLHTVEFRLQLDSNPEFTASVLAAYARAAFRLNVDGQVGCRTVFDIAPGLLDPRSPEELRNTLL